jgi:hypothetical protein
MCLVVRSGRTGIAMMSWSLRRRLLAVAVGVLLAAVATVGLVFILAIREGAEDERTQISCSLFTPHPKNTRVDYRKTDEGWLCIFIDQRGTTVLVTPPKEPQHP